MTTAIREHAVLLRAEGLELSYRQTDTTRRTVLTAFSLQIDPGEVVALVGPSGVGKSSLLRVLAGLQKPDRGCVEVHGETLAGPHPRLGLVFQDPCLLPWRDLQANVGYGLGFKHQPGQSRAERQRRVDQAIAEVDLEQARHHYPDELSGGMKQRAALARAIARQPELLLLDEPFSALDEITRAEMQSLLQSLIARHGTAAILVTHDIDEAMVLADRIILLGGHPAGALAHWPITLAHPRDLAGPELIALRVAIMRGMREARDSLSSSSHPSARAALETAS